QRRGLGVSAKEPLYVTALDTEHNRIEVGKKSSLECSSLVASGLNWIGVDRLTGPIEACGKIRYRDRETPCTIEPLGEEAATVLFDSPKSAVAKGQAAVFYRDREVLGGGFITQVMNIS
ncbi:MAG: tRNA 2-thiouridine(34) synthase MnmA, partial [Chlorobiaceae bacterium]|nr:tRNA 2-thiouridine(34) synthase MnmA [Chlorobiaceae bacterium]